MHSIMLLIIAKLVDMTISNFYLFKMQALSMKWYVEIGEKRMRFTYRTLRFTYFTLKKRDAFYRVLHDSGNNEEDIA